MRDIDNSPPSKTSSSTSSNTSTSFSSKATSSSHTYKQNAQKGSKSSFNLQRAKSSGNMLTVNPEHCRWTFRFLSVTYLDTFRTQILRLIHQEYNLKRKLLAIKMTPKYRLKLRQRIENPFPTWIKFLKQVVLKGPRVCLQPMLWNLWKWKRLSPTVRFRSPSIIYSQKNRIMLWNKLLKVITKIRNF